jgi:hypothetical protein
MPNRKTKSRKHSSKRSSRRRVARFAVSPARRLTRSLARKITLNKMITKYTKSVARMKSLNKMVARLKTESRRGSIGYSKAPKSKTPRSKKRRLTLLSLIGRGTQPIAPEPNPERKYTHPKRTRNEGGINDLPPELISKIMSNLNTNDVVSSSNVSSQWYNLGREQLHHEIAVPLRDAPDMAKKYPTARITPIVTRQNFRNFVSLAKYYDFKDVLFDDKIAGNANDVWNFVHKGNNWINVLGTKTVNGKKMRRLRRYYSFHEMKGFDDARARKIVNY